MANRWLAHVKNTMAKYPKKAFKEILKLAKKTYKKGKSVTRKVASHALKAKKSRKTRKHRRRHKTKKHRRRKPKKSRRRRRRRRRR